MIILTIENVPGKEIKEVKGLVKGSTVRCKNIGRDITASFKNLVGGEQTKARKNRKKRCNAEKEQDYLAPPQKSM